MPVRITNRSIPESSVVICGRFLCDFTETWRALREANLSRKARKEIVFRLRHYLPEHLLVFCELLALWLRKEFVQVFLRKGIR